MGKNLRATGQDEEEELLKRERKNNIA